MLSVEIKDLSYSIKDKKVLNKIDLELEKIKLPVFLVHQDVAKQLY